MHNIRETQAVSAQAAGSKSMPEHLSAPAKQLLTLLSAGALYVDEAADRLRLPAQDILRALQSWSYTVWCGRNLAGAIHCYKK